MRETWNTTFLISLIPLIPFRIRLLNYPTRIVLSLTYFSCNWKSHYWFILMIKFESNQIISQNVQEIINNPSLRINRFEHRLKLVKFLEKKYYDTFIHVLFSTVYLANIVQLDTISYFDSQTRTRIEIRVSFAVYITEPGRFLFQIEKAREVVFCAARRPSRGVKHDYHGASRRIWYQLTRSSRYRLIWPSYSRSALLSVWK